MIKWKKSIDHGAEYETNFPYKPYEENNLFEKIYKPELVSIREKSNRDKWEKEKNNYVTIKAAGGVYVNPNKPSKNPVKKEEIPKEVSSINGGKTIWNMQSKELIDRYNRTAIKATERQPLKFIDKRRENIYIGIPDKRTFDVAMNIPITETNKLENGLQLSALDSIKKYWKHEDVPTAIAWAGQESTYGAYDNLFHLGPSTLKELEDKIGKKLGNVEAAALIYYSKMKEADRLGISDEAKRLQLLQGNGSIALGHRDLKGATKIFGWDLTKGPLDFNKYPKHGQRIIDLRDNNILTNEQLMKHINQK